MKIKQFSFFLFYFFTYTLTISADDSKHLFGSETIEFKGDNSDWSVDFREHLVGTDINIEMRIAYKGKIASRHNTSRCHIFISDNAFGAVQYAFSLNRLGKYHVKSKECYGCRMLNNQEYINAEIHYDHKINHLKLKRVKINNEQ